MKLKVSPRSILLRGSSCIALFALTAGSFAACDAEGDLDLGFEETPDAATQDSSIPATDAGSDAPVVPQSKCGNKTLDQGEECDDGNTASNDGCSATCVVESNGPADRCDGAVIALTKQGTSTLYTGTVTSTTAGLYNHYTSGCGGGSGADAVYRIDPPMTGRATVRVSGAFASILSARTACASEKTELGCAEAVPSSGDAGADAGAAGSELAFPVFQGAPVYLFVDGYGGSGGEFTLDVEVQTALCGNGKAEHPEACDDGNSVDGDGCSASCTVEDSATPGTCPGMGYRLAATSSMPGTMSFAGDTSILPDNTESASGCFNNGAGPNAIYAITPTVTGNLSLSLLANYPNALLHVRRNCYESSTQADCDGATDALVPVKSDLAVTAEQTIYVIVDGSTSSMKGLYTLDATLTAAACGNGKLDGDEECDDANTAKDDGCSANCMVERDVATYTCPGKALSLDATAGYTLSVVGTTSPKSGEAVPTSKYTKCGTSNSGTSSPDVVYQVTSDVDGWLTAKVKGAFNSTVAVRASCPVATDVVDLACSRSATGNDQEVLGVAVAKDKPYFVVVDSTLGQGAFVLDLAVKPSVCGNGVVEGGETCDDGATDDGDGCTATCQLEPTSPYDVCATAPLITLEPRANGAYGKTIVTGNTNMKKEATATHSMAPCSSLWADGWYPFTPPFSGVMTARIASATFRSTIAVRTGCAPAGAQQFCDGEDAKGGQEITFSADQGKTYWIGVAGGLGVSGVPEIGRFTLDMNLVPQGCGDTFLNTPEACDDGNIVNGDGCSSTCGLETLTGLDTCPGHAIALTGTGGEARRAVATVSTVGLPSKTGGACGGSGPEGVLAITSDIDGTLNVRATGTHAVSIYARTDCADPGSEIPKASCSSTTIKAVTTPVKKNTPYYLFVDGQNGSSGVAKLQITVTP